MHQLIDRLASERVTGKLPAEHVIAIDREATRGRRPSRGTGQFEQHQLAARIQLGGRRGRYVDRQLRRHHMRVAAQIAIGKGKVQAQRSAVAAEPVAPVVADAGILGLPIFGVDLAVRRM